MIGHGGRINPALWGYIHHATEALAREFWEIVGWEPLGPSDPALLLEVGNFFLLLETDDFLLLE